MLERIPMVMVPLVLMLGCETARAQAEEPGPSHARSGDAGDADDAGMPSGFEPVPDADLELYGEVVERLDAGGYTYLAVRTDDARIRWAVVALGSPAVGERVHLRSFGLRREFRSKRLDRVFEELLFAESIATRGDLR
ncbi:hypothetical protein ACNOYE_13590 [Nannocystaceae bacterium ST9]